MKKNKTILWGGVLIVLAVLGLGIYLYHVHVERSLPTLAAKAPAKVDFYDKKDLDKHDYNAYQQTVGNYIIAAVGYNDTKDANKLAAALAHNVPEKDLNESSYMILIDWAKRTHNKVAFTKYSESMIELQKKEGYPDIAAQYESQLKQYK